MEVYTIKKLVAGPATAYPRRGSDTRYNSPGCVEAAAGARDTAKSQAPDIAHCDHEHVGRVRAGYPGYVKPDRFIRAALTAINVVPDLAKCTSTSVIAGLMQAAQLGLEVADVRGQCYLIPRNIRDWA